MTITDAAVAGEAMVPFCGLHADGPNHCPGCGGDGVYRDNAIRNVTDVPVVGHRLRMQVRVSRYRCIAVGCEREVFAHSADRLARRGSSTTRGCARYVLRRLMLDRMAVSAAACEIGLSWDTVNTIAMEATQALVAADTTRLASAGEQRRCDLARAAQTSAFRDQVDYAETPSDSETSPTTESVPCCATAT